MDYIIFKTLKGLHFIHSKHVMHRDIKPSNLLVDQYCEVRIADFGLSRTQNKIRQSVLLEKLNESKGKSSPKSSSPRTRVQKQDEEVLNLTDYVASRWYRSPEILLGSVDYTTSMDIWSLGCIFGNFLINLGEMLLGRVLFPGSSTLNQLERIFEVVGRPSETDLQAINSPTARTLLAAVETKHQLSIQKVFDGFPETTISLLSEMIQLNPTKRISAMDALKHRYISYMLVNELDLPVRYLDESKIVTALDDNLLFKVQDYRDKLQDFIDMKELKRRRFFQKTRLISKEIEREQKKRAVEKRNQQKRQGTASNNQRSYSMDDDQDDQSVGEDAQDREVELKDMLEKNQEASLDIDEYNFQNK